ncbi:hypothetical protein DFH39_005188 [Clostridium beijerinckii]|uniref:hypothetical protein n=1 Tax=Clostridium beijerinckii TaxID=1520 RepID=UPI0017B8CA0D|nr:hypothetical protein [Clostridium beijerinckii]NRU35217.1 hypothetical protein [Clostridium beijerinckii]NRU63459.1 hypothetical protein [Clostridium beijerinckii]NRW28670.1 hypothetical protein [Clostridium beijerinckii]NYC18786.1 hypothetical protein [Clostridium beijerinckii]
MKILKKILSLTFISIFLLYSTSQTSYASPDISSQTPLKVGVFLNSFSDLFISNVKKNLEDIQKQNENKVQFTFLMPMEIKLFKMKMLTKHSMIILIFLY